MAHRTAAELGEAALAILEVGPPATPPRMMGPLSKQASNWLSGYQGRHFEVADGSMRYWQSPVEMKRGEKPHAEYSLFKCALKPDPDSTTKFEVCFRAAKDRPYALDVMAGGPTREQWLDALTQNVEHARRLVAYHRAVEMIDSMGWDVDQEVPPGGGADEIAQGEPQTPQSFDVELPVAVAVVVATEENVPKQAANPAAGYSEQRPPEAPKPPAQEKRTRFVSEEAIVEFEAASFSDELSLMRVASLEPTVSFMKLEAAVTLAAHGTPPAPPSLSGPMMKQATSWHGSFQQRYFEVAEGKFKYWPSVIEYKAGEEANAEYTLVGVKTWQCWEPVSQFELMLKANADRPPYVLQAAVTGPDAEAAHSLPEWIEALKAHEAWAVRKIVYDQAVKLADA